MLLNGIFQFSLNSLVERLGLVSISESIIFSFASSSSLFTPLIAPLIAPFLCVNDIKNVLFTNIKLLKHYIAPIVFYRAIVFYTYFKYTINWCLSFIFNNYCIKLILLTYQNRDLNPYLSIEKRLDNEYQTYAS